MNIFSFYEIRTEWRTFLKYFTSFAKLLGSRMTQKISPGIYTI